MHSKFTIKDLGLVRYFLGLEVLRSAHGTLLNQRKYVSDLLVDHNLQDCKSAPFPLPRGLQLSIDQGELLDDPEKYRRVVGRLLYLKMSRLDISYAVQHLSQFMNEPREPHYKAVLHVLRYLKGTVNMGLFFPVENFAALTAFCDVDWGNCLFSGRSLTGFCVFFGHSLISWKTKK